MDGSYDSAYDTTDALFGRDPERIVVDHAHLLPVTGDVIDIGCGQGRHALWLGRRGRPVVAVDPSEVAVRIVSEAARAESLPVTTLRRGFAELADPPRPYAGVIVVGLVQMLAPPELRALIERIVSWTTAGSVLFLVAWSEDDPRFAEIAASWTPLGGGSFRGADGRTRTFLPRGSAPSMFPGWETVHHAEALGEWHRHGDAPAERHGRVELVAIRR